MFGPLFHNIRESVEGQASWSLELAFVEAFPLGPSTAMFGFDVLHGAVMALTGLVVLSASCLVGLWFVLTAFAGEQ